MYCCVINSPHINGLRQHQIIYYFSWFCGLTRQFHSFMWCQLGYRMARINMISLLQLAACDDSLVGSSAGTISPWPPHWPQLLYTDLSSPCNYLGCRTTWVLWRSCPDRQMEILKSQPWKLDRITTMHSFSQGSHRTSQIQVMRNKLHFWMGRAAKNLWSLFNPHSSACFHFSHPIILHIASQLCSLKTQVRPCHSYSKNSLVVSSLVQTKTEVFHPDCQLCFIWSLLPLPGLICYSPHSSHISPWCFSKSPVTFLSGGICIGCSLCLHPTDLCLVHSLLYFLQVFNQNFSSWGPPSLE